MPENEAVLQPVRDALVADPPDLDRANQSAEAITDPALRARAAQLIDRARARRAAPASGGRLAGLLSRVPARWRAVAAVVVAATGALGYYFTGRPDPFAPETAAVPLPAPFPAAEPDGRGGLMTLQHGTLVGLKVVPAPPTITLSDPFEKWDRRGRFRSAWAAPHGGYNVDGGLLYDANYLYIRARVADPWPMRSTSPPDAGPNVGWDGGSIQLHLATRGEAADDHPADTFYHLTLWYHMTDKRAYLQVARGRQMELDPARKPVPSADAEGEFAARFALAPGGYDVTARVPWGGLGLDASPKPDAVFGMCWEVCWNERGQRFVGKLTEFFRPDKLRELVDREPYLPAVPGKLSYQRPSIWGKATFSR